MPPEQATNDTVEIDEDKLFEEAAQLLGGKSQLSLDLEDTDEANVDETVEAGEAEDEPVAKTDDTEAPKSLWDSVSEEQKQEWLALNQRVERLSHDLSTAKRGQSDMQKKYNEATAEAEKLKTLTATVSDDEKAPLIAQFEEDFPEIATAVNAIHKRELAQIQSKMDNELKELKSQLANLSEPVRSYQEERQANARTQALSQLREKHPDFEQIQNTNQFWAWVESQPESLKGLAGSSNPDDAATLLDLYKVKKGIATTTPEAKPAATRIKRTAEAEGVLPKSGVKITETVPEDEDRAFEYWAEKLKQSR